MKVDWVPFGEICTASSSSTDVAPDASYPMMGVRSFGRGSFASELLSGGETSYSTLQRTETNQIVYPKLMAWEGAFDVVPTELSGRFVSPEFILLDLIPKRASPEYVRNYLHSSRFGSLVQSQSRGTNVRRRRLRQSEFLSLRVPLPSLAEQARIAEHLRQIGREHKSTTRQDPSRVALDSTLSAWLGQLPAAPLGELIEFAPKPRKVDSADEVQFVPMAAVDPITGTITNAEVKSRGEVGTGYRQFIPCLLYTSPSPRDKRQSRMPSSA